VSTAEFLGHLGGALNAAVAILLLAAFAAIRAGRKSLHARLMLSALSVGIVFLALYVYQWAALGHSRFPGHDWVRAVFLVILGTHELMAMVVVPLIARTVYLASRQRFEEHRRIVRFTYPVWLYVALTGVLIYWMNQHVRPHHV
jgi:putative membrane protein